MRLIAILLFLPGVAFAGVYQCQKDGKSTYQDHPCDSSSSQQTLQKSELPAFFRGGEVTRTLGVCERVFIPWQGVASSHFPATALWPGRVAGQYLVKFDHDRSYSSNWNVRVLEGPKHGTLSVVHPNNDYAYVPARDFEGEDQVVMRAENLDTVRKGTVVTVRYYLLVAVAGRHPACQGPDGFWQIQ